jgi:hypothetical protein
MAPQEQQQQAQHEGCEQFRQWTNQNQADGKKLKSEFSCKACLPD